ncbi:hypothetical protein ACFXPY_37125 [Streptomyces sp. NPDC059153]|uniref:hypothetical protein n=1 Tax=Streptomyces sp. NPDC059153 TaxID=3346743 RepID=UPI0036C6EA51
MPEELDGADSVQRGKRCLAAEALRVVPHGDEQSGGRVRADAHHSEQLRGVAFRESGQAAFQVSCTAGLAVEVV